MSSKRFEAVIFDLDGTLLNTLPDLVELTNAVMDMNGYPTHTTEEVLSYVGGGVRLLLQKALPAECTDADIARCQGQWMEMYPKFGFELTEPYPGIPEALELMKAEGLKLGVLSNKFDDAARETIAAFFPGVFDIVRGECAGVPRKPDPTGLLTMISELGTTPNKTAYVGDSGATDMAVAVAAGAFPVGAKWGYQPTEALVKYGAQVLLDSPAELAGTILER